MKKNTIITNNKNTSYDSVRSEVDDLFNMGNTYFNQFNSANELMNCIKNIDSNTSKKLNYLSNLYSNWENFTLLPTEFEFEDIDGEYFAIVFDGELISSPDNFTHEDVEGYINDLSCEMDSIFNQVFTY